jgi:WD40 repeat protein
MNDVPRQTLKHIIQQYGPEVCDDRRRCTGLLRDLCGEYRREIFVLISALEQNVVDGLRTLTGQLPFSVVLPRLATELHETTALSEEAARWAVAVWADALGLVSESDIQTTLSRYSGAVQRSGSGGANPAAVHPSPATVDTMSDYQLTYQWTAHEGEVSSIAFGPDGHHLLSVGMDARARVWDVAGAQAEATLNQQTGILTAGAWHPDGLTVALGSGDMGVYLWHWSAPGTNVPRLRGHQGAVTGVTFLAAGDTLASSSQDGTLKVWDVEARTVTATLRGHSDAVLDLAAGHDGATLVSAGGWDRTVRVWDVAQRRDLWSLRGHTAQVTSVDVDAAGQTLASGSWDETVRIWNAQRGLAIGAMRADPSPGTAAQGEAEEKQAARLITSVAFAPDGKLLAASDWNGQVQLWDVQHQTLLATLSGHTAHVRRVAFSPRGRWLASADDAGTVGLWRRN